MWKGAAAQAVALGPENRGTMDIAKTLRELYEEKKQVDRAIARLEARLAGMSQRQPKRQLQRRGRKGMGEEEREVVSRRMKAYWASRRALREAMHADAEKGEDTQAAAGSASA